MRFIDRDEIEGSLPAHWTNVVTTALKHVADKVNECKQECLAKALSPAETEKAVAKARSKAINEEVVYGRKREATSENYRMINAGTARHTRLALTCR